MGQAGSPTASRAPITLRWIDLGTAAAELNANHPVFTAHEWAHLVTGMVVSVMLPLAIGFVRLHHRGVTSS